MAGWQQTIQVCISLVLSWEEMRQPPPDGRAWHSCSRLVPPTSMTTRRAFLISRLEENRLPVLQSVIIKELRVW